MNCGPTLAFGQPQYWRGACCLHPQSPADRARPHLAGPFACRPGAYFAVARVFQRVAGADSCLRHRRSHQQSPVVVCQPFAAACAPCTDSIRRGATLRCAGGRQQQRLVAAPHPDSSCREAASCHRVAVCGATGVALGPPRPCLPARGDRPPFLSPFHRAHRAVCATRDRLRRATNSASLLTYFAFHPARAAPLTRAGLAPSYVGGSVAARWPLVLDRACPIRTALPSVSACVGYTTGAGLSGALLLTAHPACVARTHCLLTLGAPLAGHEAGCLGAQRRLRHTQLRRGFATNQASSFLMFGSALHAPAAALAHVLPPFLIPSPVLCFVRWYATLQARGRPRHLYTRSVPPHNRQTVCRCANRARRLASRHRPALLTARPSLSRHVAAAQVSGPTARSARHRPSLVGSGQAAVRRRRLLAPCPRSACPRLLRLTPRSGLVLSDCCRCDVWRRPSLLNTPSCLCRASSTCAAAAARSLPRRPPLRHCFSDRRRCSGVCGTAV